MHTQPEPDPHHPGFAEDPRPPVWLGVAFIFIAVLAVVLFALVVRHQSQERAAARSLYFTLTLNAERCPRPLPGQVLVITASPALPPGGEFTVQCTTAQAKS